MSLPLWRILHPSFGCQKKDNVGFTWRIDNNAGCIDGPPENESLGRDSFSLEWEAALEWCTVNESASLSKVGQSIISKIEFIKSDHWDGQLSGFVDQLNQK